MLSHVKLASNRERPRIAIIAHDGKKADLVAFATFNRSRLQEYDIVATGATGDLLRDKVGLDVERVTAGPHGGDVQIASRGQHSVCGNQGPGLRPGVAAAYNPARDPDRKAPKDR